MNDSPPEVPGSFHTWQCAIIDNTDHGWRQMGTGRASVTGEEGCSDSALTSGPAPAFSNAITTS